MGQNWGSLRPAPLTLLKSMAPGKCNWRQARSSSRTLAAGSFNGRVASAVKRPPLVSRISREGVVDQAGEASRGGQGLDVGAGGGEGEDLRIDAVLDQHLLAVVDIAVAGDGDVVVAGIVDARIAVLVDGDFDGAGAGAQGVQVGRRIEVIVKINDGHASSDRQAILTRR